MDRFHFSNTNYGEQPAPLSMHPREGYAIVGSLKVRAGDRPFDVYGPEGLTANPAQCAALLKRGGQKVDELPRAVWARVDRQVSIGATEAGEVYVARRLSPDALELTPRHRGSDPLGGPWLVAAADAALLEEVEDERIDAWREAWRRWPSEALPLWLGEPWLAGDDAGKWKPPTVESLRGLLAAAGVYQKAAAGVVGANERTMRKWCGGEAPMDFATWFTLRTLLSAAWR